MTIKELAQSLGVSPSTVSRVLADPDAPCASRALREKITHAALTMGYAPNPNAQNLRRGEAQTPNRPRVAVALARIRELSDDPFFKELYRSLESELFRRGCALSGIARVREDAPMPLPECDALVVLGRCPEGALKPLQAACKTVVGIWRNPLNFEVDEVVCDGKKAAAMAVNYLRELGHTRIAYIGDCSYESRYVGYCETLIKNDLPLDYSLIYPTDQTEAAGQSAMARLVAGGKATCVLCANDLTAIGALKSLPKKRPVSVISIDDIDEAQETKPLLTTVSIPRADMARMAVSVLLDRLRRGQGARVRVELPCRIVVRESCFAV